MGLNAAHANYSCIYCTIKKDMRFDTTVPPEEYEVRKAPSLSSLVTCAETQSLGVLHKPLFNIQLEQVVIDEFHLMLRITDVLNRNLIWIAQAHDTNEITVQRSTKHLDMVTDSIRSCGITFRIKKTELEWTSLRGSDRKKLLLKLPSILPDIFPGELGRKLMKHWVDFKNIYEIIGLSNPTNEDINNLQRKSLEWIKDFISFPYDGYNKSHVTPYMHIMAYHVPFLMKQYNGIKRFTGQGVEKNNDTARKYYFSSNYKDAPKDILLTGSRVEELQQKNKRTKRKCKKVDMTYWEEGIIQKRRKSLPSLGSFDDEEEPHEEPLQRRQDDHMAN